jgi:hypothetical protein
LLKNGRQLAQASILLPSILLPSILNQNGKLRLIHRGPSAMGDARLLIVQSDSFGVDEQGKRILFLGYCRSFHSKGAQFNQVNKMPSRISSVAKFQFPIHCPLFLAYHLPPSNIFKPCRLIHRDSRNSTAKRLE